MKVVVVGATGNVGPHVVAELLARGHQVTAISRHPDSLEDQAGLTKKSGDIEQPEKLAAALSDHDAIITSVRFVDFNFDKLMQAIKSSSVDRYLVVGGAGSLTDTNGALVYERPAMPEPARHNSKLGGEWLDAISQTDLDWTMLCPGLKFFDGTRTGTFRLGKDDLIVADDGTSSISFQDYAIALVDELETPKHSKQRFAVGY